MKGRCIEGCLLTCLCLVTACTDDFAPQSELSSLRVLAVQPEPASGIPGEQVHLRMLYYDGRSRDGNPDPPHSAQIVWLAGCHNPPSLGFYACYPLIHAAMAQFGKPYDTLPVLPVPGVFGVGDEFDFQVPADILESAPSAKTDAIHYGVSYVFFAACAGELRLVAGPGNRLPLGCFDPDTGERLGAQDYVEGFTTLFSFEGNVNNNPELSGVLFAGAKVSADECADDADCVDVESGSETFSDYGCGSAGRCVPRVERCSPAAEDSCPEYPVFPEISPDSAEPDPSAPFEDGHFPGEILWVNFYADAGEFSFDTRLAHDRQLGWIDNRASRYRPLSREPGSVRFFTTLHDNRGGASWQSFEVLVRDAEE